MEKIVFTKKNFPAWECVAKPTQYDFHRFFTRVYLKFDGGKNFLVKATFFQIFSISDPMYGHEILNYGRRISKKWGVFKIFIYQNIYHKVPKYIWPIQDSK